MADTPLTTQQHQSREAIRSISSASFISSPLKPGSRLAMFDDRPSRGSMILYRLADNRDRQAGGDHESLLVPPKFPSNRNSLVSNSRDSIVSFAPDSKYPSAIPGTYKDGIIPYSYDPTQDELDAPNDDDLLHDHGSHHHDNHAFPWRGILNISVLLLLLLCILALFISYPVMSFYKSRSKSAQITGNIRVNATGQSPVLFNMPDLIDLDTPHDALSRSGLDGSDYTLVFSDEFSTPGRSFYPGDDPFWEAVDIWYGATGDLEWYDPQQVTTRDGALVITMDSVDTLQPGLTPSRLQSSLLCCFSCFFSHKTLPLLSPLLTTIISITAVACSNLGTNFVLLEVTSRLPSSSRVPTKTHKAMYVSHSYPSPHNLVHLVSGLVRGSWATWLALALPPPPMVPGPIPTTRVMSAPFQIRPTQMVSALLLPFILMPHALNMTSNSVGFPASDYRPSTFPSLQPDNNFS